MEIYLRQRSGIVCLITIALLLVFSHLYNHSSASRRFRRMCIYALCHVVLTILTEVTANLLDTTPLLENRLLTLGAHGDFLELRVADDDGIVHSDLSFP